ncbi:MAG: hypothetical protein Q9167_004467 [Letrouitia subvulpina]
MAPKKKGRKAVSNPARGFATVSTTPKSKMQDVEQRSPEDDKQVIKADLETNPTTNVTENHASEQKELKDLSPEELEKELEESEIQFLLENNVEKVKKDVSRQLNRLKTEMRLLRPQAEHLPTSSWLPSELLQPILKLTETALHCTNGNLEHYSRKWVKPVTYDDLIVKLWNLESLLGQLGFAEGAVHSAVTQLGFKVSKSPALASCLTLDPTWGLDNCLYWLALNCEIVDLPPYDHFKSKANTNTTKNTLSSSSESRKYKLSDTILNDREKISSSIFQSTSRTSESDHEYDDDPVRLIDTYLALQSSLYHLDPAMANAEHQRTAYPRAKSRNRQVEKQPDVNPEASKLLQKIKSLKLDILFDFDEANEKWMDVRNKFTREAAERKKLGVFENFTAANTAKQPVRQMQSNPTRSVELPNEVEQEEMVGDFFSDMPDISDVASPSSIDDRLVVRNFGVWNGLNPRRIFEEACKTRDPFVQITYNPIDRSAFLKQHSLFVQWSSIQATPIPLPVPRGESIRLKADTQSAMLEMISVATPDALQSESLISTWALFLIFSSSPKEEKAYLRLPSVWRDVWSELVAMKKESDNTTIRNTLRELRSHVHNVNTTAERDDSLPAWQERNSHEKVHESDLGHKKAHNKGQMSSETLTDLWSSRSKTSQYQKWLKFRRTLPVWSFKDDLLHVIENFPVIIICGETGCGKSTQVPSFILENELSHGRSCKIYCTEPRRISAISLAQRVSEEIGEAKGDLGGARSLIGYAIRLESKMNPTTRLVYATTGIVMRMLESSDDLREITHLILDEVHERSIEIDFLLIILKKLLIRRSSLKIILMSATVNAQKFSAYLNDAPIMSVPGRTFYVDTRYLEDAVELTKYISRDSDSDNVRYVESSEDDDEDSRSRKSSVTSAGLCNYSASTRNTLAKLDEYRIDNGLIIALIKAIATADSLINYSKAVLVFLPGIGEIRRLSGILSTHPFFCDSWKVYALHSTIAMEEQEQVFLIPPKGIRKIVLATNIAETGVTIPDITCVIDTGKHKEMRFDEKRQLSRLIEVFISRQNAKQRRGRAGRIAEEPTPEILRLSLQDLVLRVKICRLGSAEAVLLEALDPPSSKNIRRAVDSLIDVKALTHSEELTPLGRQLAKLPLDIFLGKLILLGSIFRCLDGALTIAAILSAKSPFSAPIDARSHANAARLAFKRETQIQTEVIGDSDLLTVLNAYTAWKRVCGNNASFEHQFCHKNFLIAQTLSSIEELKGQLLGSLVEAGFLKLDEGEVHALQR